MTPDSAPDRAAASAPPTPTSDTVPVPALTDETATFRPVTLPDLSPYRVIRLLGAGGMGEVYLADDPKVGRPVAVKRMRPALAAAPGARDRFLREARAMGAVQHDHVVPVYHVGEDPAGVPYIVMPVLHGETLAERVRRSGPLSATELIALGRGVSDGLAAAHSRGLVHRDVKPSNVWLEATADDRFRVKLLDFGLARAADGGDGLTRDGAVMGTPAYMSPEQADGRPADERADLFSLGVVLYHAAAGDSPFLRASTTATLNAVGNHTPPDVRAVNAAVPPALAELILRLLSKEPTARPTSAAAVAAALRRMEPSTPAPTEVVVPRRPSRFRRMRRWPWWAGGVTALVLVGILVWAATRPTRAAVVRWECQFTRQALVGPLSPGDTAQLWVGLNRPAHVYVLWFNADGTVDRWYPWARDGTRERIGDAPAASFERRYTLAGGPAGLETIVILVRATRLPGDDPFPPRIDVRPPADPIALVHHRPVKTRNGEPVELDRGAAAEADPLAPAGPVLDLCRAWRAQGVCDDFVTVTFAVTGGR